MLKLFNVNDTLYFLCTTCFHKCRLEKVAVLRSKEKVFNDSYNKFTQHLDIDLSMCVIARSCCKNIHCCSDINADKMPLVT